MRLNWAKNGVPTRTSTKEPYHNNGNRRRREERPRRPAGGHNCLGERWRRKGRCDGGGTDTRGPIRPASSLRRPSLVFATGRPLGGAALFHAQFQPPLCHRPIHQTTEEMPVGSHSQHRAVLSTVHCRSASQTDSIVAPTSTTMERKRKKPLMEKKRRLRFNANLGELMALVLDKDQAGSTKVEKADVLEQAVRYLRTIENQRLVRAIIHDRNVSDQFLAGFGDCKMAVENFVRKNDSNGGFDRDLGERLVRFLEPYNCLGQKIASVVTMSQATALVQKRYAMQPKSGQEIANEFENRKRILEHTKDLTEQNHTTFEIAKKKSITEDDDDVAEDGVAGSHARQAIEGSKIWRPYD